MADVRRRRLKIPTPRSPVVRPPLPVVNLPVVRGERRHVLTARPDGKIFWQSWGEHQARITKQVIQHKVRMEESWK